MKIVKLVVGTLAAILVLLKGLSLAILMTTGEYSHVPKPVNSWLLGNVAALVIGLAIVIICFRKKA